MSNANRFVLTIRLGNEAMQTGRDVAAQLRRLAQSIDYDAEFTANDDSGKLYDVNGNLVGAWHVDDES